jgi:hypothetical protein
LPNEISILRAVRETPDGQTGAPSEERACPVCSDEPLGDTTAGRICVIHQRYLVMTDCLQVKQQGRPLFETAPVSPHDAGKPPISRPVWAADDLGWKAQTRENAR